MAATAIVLLFGVTCPEPCDVPRAELAMIERQTAKLLAEKGMAVKPAGADEARPTGESASLELADEAKKRDVDRVIALDLEPPIESGARTLWVTHFLRGTAGPWAVGRASCKKGKGGVFECPGLARSVLSGLRPRKAADVDMVAVLRSRARGVGRCVRAEDEVPVAERIFGKVEMDLKVRPSGRVEVVAIAPVVAARSHLGSCLSKVMEGIDVGPFEGEPIELRVPVDL